MNDSTIAAISTAYGESGIGVIRISGPQALSIAERIFVPAANRDDFCFVPRYMHYGRIADPGSGRILDEALCVYMKAPFSYTAEDVVEIQCHGSLVSLQRIMQLVLRMGAEPADKGEFTKRAFLNGRLDLAQAESIIDLIRARGSAGFDVAMDQLQGSLSAKIRELRQQLLDVLVNITVNMDYPDEDIEQITYTDVLNSLSPISDELCKLNASSGEGKILREGLGLAIVGKPNVGKSSIMNALLKEERSIVTDIPGTTRDVISEAAVIRGIKIDLTDTAGIRRSEDLVESLGIERSKAAFNAADMLLLIIDSSSALSAEDIELLKMCEGRQALCVLNKSDLCSATGESELCKYFSGRIINASAFTGEGIEDIKDCIEQLVSGGRLRREGDAVLTNQRHIRLIEQAISEITQAMELCIKAEALDFIEVNVRAAFELLGEITGDTASDQIIDEVFERFCLGK